MFTETLIKITISAIWSIPHFMPWKCAKIYQSQAASSMIFQAHMRLPVCMSMFKIAAVGSLKRDSERVISKQFHRSEEYL